MTERVVGRVLLVVALLIAVAACGDDDQPAPRPAVQLVLPAIEALEAHLGAPQEYFEINVDQRLVNLFVAVEGGRSFIPYLYLDGEIQPPAPSQPVEAGETFAAEDMRFDPEKVLQRVADDLPTSAMERFVILVGPDGVVRYEVFVRSARGGQLAVAVTGDGDVLGVESL
ncbi:hypothetical protein BH23ACT3_BH23ACT3_11940 [soil metagenome]